MSRPTDALRADHETVAAGLAVLRAIGTHVRAGGAFPAAAAAEALRFLREFVVAVHFRKENEVVWPALALRGSDEAAADVGGLLRLQDEATQLVTALVVLWEPIGELTFDERRGFADTIEALESALARMQATEERLFRDCDIDVPADDQLDWPAEFAAVEAERCTRKSWAVRLDSLATTWH